MYDNLNGILIDFVSLSNIKDIFDHKHLNDVVNINPTCENIAAIICLMASELMVNRFQDASIQNPEKHFTVSVKLWESKNSYFKISDKEAQNWLGTSDYKKFINC